jgi:hypothetical protein
MSQLGGEYVSVNVNCMDDVDPATLKAVYWDETYRKTRRREGRREGQPLQANLEDPVPAFGR